MKDIILLLLQIVVMACILGGIGSLLNYTFGWSIGLNGNELPGDMRAVSMFAIIGLIAAIAVAYGERKLTLKKS